MSNVLGAEFPTVLAAARIGAEWAWKALYRSLAPSVLGYLMARGAAEPEDVAGEVFVQVVRDLERFEGDESSFRSWVFTIAHHRLIDAGRARARRPVEPLGHEQIVAVAGGGHAQTEALIVSDDRVRRVLHVLSPDQQSVLLLRVIGDLSVRDVAKVIGKSEGAVRLLQHRALAAAKRALDQEGVTV